MRKLLTTVFSVMLVCSISSSANFIAGKSPASGEQSRYEYYSANAGNWYNLAFGKYTGKLIPGVSSQTKERAFMNNRWNSISIPVVERKAQNAHKDIVVTATNQYVYVPLVQRHSRTNQSYRAIVNSQYNFESHYGRTDGFGCTVGKPRHYTDNSTGTQSVPEPSMVALTGIGLAGVLLVRRKKSSIPCLSKR